MLRPPFLSLLVFTMGVACAVPAGAPAAPPAGPRLAPSIPRGAELEERRVLMETAYLLSQRSFDQATTLARALLPKPVTRVYVDWTPVPAEYRNPYRGAIQQALTGWNRGLARAIELRLAAREADADLVLLFEQSVVRLADGQPQLLCSEGGKPETAALALMKGGARRTARARLALTVPYSPAMHPPACITHLAGQAIGQYLGLPPSTEAGGMMGPDRHEGEVALEPSPGEAQLARELQKARLEMVALAAGRAAVHLPLPAMVVEKPALDAGEVVRGEVAHFVYRITNRGDAPLEIAAKPNCGCIVSQFDAVIPPGGEGKIRAELQTSTFRGATEKFIAVTSNDFRQPALLLSLHANVVPAIEVTPAGTVVISLKAEGKTVQEYELRVREAEPVEITRVACSASYAAAAVEPVSGPPGTGRTYRLTLTVQPEAPLGRSSIVISAQTTSRREPLVRISALLEKGIVLQPATVYMGTLKASPPAPVSQVVTLSRRGAPFRIEKLESDNPNLAVRQEEVAGGEVYRLTLTYRGGWPAGVFRGKVTVVTNDAQQPTITIPVLASVVAGEVGR